MFMFTKQGLKITPLYIRLPTLPPGSFSSIGDDMHRVLRHSLFMARGNRQTESGKILTHTCAVPPKSRREAKANGCKACANKVDTFRAKNRDYDKNRRGVAVSGETLAERRAKRMAKYMPADQGEY